MSSTCSCPKCGAALDAFATEGFCSACLLEAAVQPDAAGGAASAASFGDYEIVREIARGGMGVVYLARQSSLGRTVALKMILGGRLAGEAEVARFRAEARAAAALQHPHIVAIHDVGEAHGQQFYSMDFVPGRSLAGALQDGPMAAPRAARLLQAVAGAVHYAHGRGILHRDLKPANVLLDEHDQPRVTDFGLAKQFLNSEQGTRNAELTQTGQVLGSPNFMPPEQAAGKHRELTPAADIYSLGALLYHCLTGRPPFLADSMPETLRLAAETEPVAPRLLNPSIPRDLETICLECLAKEPSRRYATAQELADELGRFLRDEPIRARPAGRAEKFWRWCRRHPALASVSALAGLLVIAVVTITTASVIRLERANEKGQEKLWQSYLAQARANRWSGRPGRRFGTLDVIQKAAAIRPSIELRNEAIAAMALPDVRPVKVIHKGTNFAKFSPDFTRYVQIEPDGGFHFRHTTNDQTYFTWQPPSGVWQVLHQQWSPDGRYTAIGLMRPPKFHLEVLDLQLGRSLMSRENYGLRQVDFSKNFARMALVGRTNNQGKGQLELFDWPAGTLLRSELLEALPYSVRFDPSGRRLAISSTESSRIRIMDAETGEVLRELQAATGANRIDWSADGRKLAVAGGDGYVYVWDMEKPSTPPLKLPHGDVVIVVSFDPAGEWLVSSGWDTQMRIWNLVTGLEVHRAAAMEGAVFSGANRMISYNSSLEDQTIGEFHGADEYRRLPATADRIAGRVPSFSPDGRILAAPLADHTRLYDATTGRELARLPGSAPEAALFSPAGDWLAIRTDVRLELWRIEQLSASSGSPLRFSPWRKIRLLGSSGPLSTDEAGRRLAVLDRRTPKVFDIASGENLLDSKRLRISPEGWYPASVSADGRTVIASTYLSSSSAYAWEIDSAAPGRALPFGATTGFARSADGRYLISGSQMGYAGWNAGTRAPLWQFARTAAGGSHPRLALASRVRLGAVTYSKTSVRLLDPEDGRELATVEAPEEVTIHSLTLAPDGDRLAVYTMNGLAVWDLRAVRRQLAAMNLDWDMPPLPPAPATNAPLAIVVAALGQESDAPAEETYPPRDPACTSRHIDLSAHYNTTLTSSWQNPRWEKNYLPVPRGLHRLDGVAFDLRGFVQLSGTELDMSNRYPAEVTDIPIGLKTPALHFLHATGWEPPDGTDVGSYALRYADGLELRVPLINARNIRVWSRSPKDSVSLHPASTVAWRGDNPHSKAHGWSATLYRFRLENPRPDVAIASLDFISAGTKAAPFLVAITAE